MTGVTAYRPVSEESLKEALTATRGDLFQVACLHGCTFREIDSFIKRNPELSQFVATINTIKTDDGYAKFSDEQFADQLAYLTKQYRFEALESIHELATMKPTNAAEMEIKLRAATQLRGGDVHHGGLGNGQQGVLEELALDYAAAAPRIREIRQTVITMDMTVPNRQSASHAEVLQPHGDAHDQKSLESNHG